MFLFKITSIPLYPVLPVTPPPAFAPGFEPSAPPPEYITSYFKPTLAPSAPPMYESFPAHATPVTVAQPVYLYPAIYFACFNLQTYPFSTTETPHPLILNGQIYQPQSPLAMAAYLIPSIPNKDSATRAYNRIKTKLTLTCESNRTLFELLSISELLSGDLLKTVSATTPGLISQALSKLLTPEIVEHLKSETVAKLRTETKPKQQVKQIKAALKELKSKLKDAQKTITKNENSILQELTESHTADPENVSYLLNRGQAYIASALAQKVKSQLDNKKHPPTYYELLARAAWDLSKAFEKALMSDPSRGEKVLIPQILYQRYKVHHLLDIRHQAAHDMQWSDAYRMNPYI